MSKALKHQRDGIQTNMFMSITKARSYQKQCMSMWMHDSPHSIYASMRVHMIYMFMVIKQIKTLISIKEVNKQSKAKQRSREIKKWKKKKKKQQQQQLKLRHIAWIKQRKWKQQTWIWVSRHEYACAYIGHVYTAQLYAYACSKRAHAYRP